jgi:DNA-binding NtrC family response regulator
VAPCTIAQIELQASTCQTLQVLLGPDLELIAVPTEGMEPSRVAKARVFLVGNTHSDPSLTIHIIRRLREMRPSAPVLLIAWESSENLAIAALREGVADYFPPPVDLSRVAEVACRIALNPVPVLERTVSACDTGRGCRPIIGESVVMKSLRSWLLRVAQRDCNTLILGETGTGKDLIAEAVHANSPRRSKPFVSVNCAAIPDTLLESELFGYERGAFTGANSTTLGKIQQAHEGTIFFDEIGELTPSAQAKVLRVMESKQIQRLGGKGSISVNVRIVAATNQDLPRLVSEQRFRKDLYFRLNVAKIQLPSLRERREDIRPLLEYFLQVYNRQTGASVEGFTEEAMEWLVGYAWPGNVRELKNSLESVFIDPPHPRIDLCHLCMSSHSLQLFEGFAGERDRLLDALKSTHWNKSRAAEKLQWSRMKIYRKITKYRIETRETECDLAGGDPRTDGQADS